MPVELKGQPNGWAGDFYRCTEDFVYCVMSLAKYLEYLDGSGLSRDTVDELINKMTVPPPIDYTRDA
jgi:hypothetical protein